MVKIPPDIIHPGKPKEFEEGLIQTFLIREQDLIFNAFLRQYYLMFIGAAKPWVESFRRPEVIFTGWSIYKLNSVFHRAFKNYTSLSEKQLTLWTGSIQNYNWYFKTLAPGVKRIYLRAKINNVSVTRATLNFSPQTGWESFANITGYTVSIEPGQAAADLRLERRTGGENYTNIAYEAVDLSNDTYYDIEFLWDLETGALKVWRDGNLVIDETDTTYTSCRSVFLHTYHTTSEYAKFKEICCIVDYGSDAVITVDDTTNEYDNAWTGFVVDGRICLMGRAGGTAHGYDTNAYACLWYSDDDGNTWNKKTIYSSANDHRVGAGGVTPSEIIVAGIYKGYSDGTTHLKYMYSEDKGETWSDLFQLETNTNAYIQRWSGKAIYVPKKGMLMHYYIEDTTNSPEGYNYHVRIVWSKDDGKTWENDTPVYRSNDTEANETAFVYLGEGRILGISRVDGENYAYVQHQSEDYGETWTSTKITSEISYNKFATPWLERVGDYVILTARDNAVGYGIQIRIGKIDDVWNNGDYWRTSKPLQVWNVGVAGDANPIICKIKYPEFYIAYSTETNVQSVYMKRFCVDLAIGGIEYQTL